MLIHMHAALQSSHAAASKGTQEAAGSPQAEFPPPPTCPGIRGGVCTLPCQRATCDALAAFFRLTFNESSPWHRPETWEVIKTVPCSRIIPSSGSGGQPPAYCKWYGITCCDPQASGAGLCGPVHSLANLTLTADSLNGSYSNPAVMDALEQLHACGMVVLDLESNDMSGEMNGRWGRFTNLTVLNLGKHSRL